MISSELRFYSAPHRLECFSRARLGSIGTGLIARRGKEFNQGGKATSEELWMNADRNTMRERDEEA